MPPAQILFISKSANPAVPHRDVLGVLPADFEDDIDLWEEQQRRDHLSGEFIVGDVGADGFGGQMAPASGGSYSKNAEPVAEFITNLAKPLMQRLDRPSASWQIDAFHHLKVAGQQHQIGAN